MLHKEFLIRPAKNEDIAAIKKVAFTVLREYGLNPDEEGKDSDLNNVEKSYFSRNGYFGVAVNINSNEVVGTFGLYVVNDEVCELRKMYLQSECRGKGLGKFILDKTIEMARIKAFRKIFLETISPLKVAIVMYKNAGFIEVEPKQINERTDRAFELTL